MTGLIKQQEAQQRRDGFTRAMALSWTTSAPPAAKRRPRPAGPTRRCWRWRKGVLSSAGGTVSGIVAGPRIGERQRVGAPAGEEAGAGREPLLGERRVEFPWEARRGRAGGGFVGHGGSVARRRGTVGHDHGSFAPSERPSSK